MRKQLQGDATGRLQLELGWLSVVEVMKLTQLPLPIARLTITCKWRAACDIGQCAGPDAEYQLNTLSDGDVPLSDHDLISWIQLMSFLLAISPQLEIDAAYRPSITLQFELRYTHKTFFLIISL